MQQHYSSYKGPTITTAAAAATTAAANPQQENFHVCMPQLYIWAAANVLAVAMAGFPYGRAENKTF